MESDSPEPARTNPRRRLEGSARPGTGGESAHRLDAGPVYGTARRLERRVRARFPERHLAELADQLCDLVETIGRERGRSPAFVLIRNGCRVLIAVIVVAVTATVVVGAGAAFGEAHRLSAIDWPPLVESTINDIVFAGVAVFFLHALPERLERRRVLGVLHRLRSLAHVIDMHQLTKDPERIRARYSRTAESVRDTMTAEELFHYLDYCSEMLSLVGKSAALYAQSTSDDVVLTSIEGIESLTTGLQTKIWQKIALLP